MFLIFILYCFTPPVVYIPHFGKICYYWKSKNFEVKILYLLLINMGLQNHILFESVSLFKVWLYFFLKFPHTFGNIFLWELHIWKIFLWIFFVIFSLESTPFKSIFMVFSWLWILAKSPIDIRDYFSVSINIGGKNQTFWMLVYAMSILC